MAVLEQPPSSRDKFESIAWQGWFLEVWKRLKGPRTVASGSITLTAGSATVLTPVTATNGVLLTILHATNPGFLSVSSRVAGVSFTVTSTSGTDASVIQWLLID